MMHGHKESDSAIVAGKPTNKAAQPPAERSAAEPTAADPVERRAGTKGDADQQSTCRTQSPSVSQALDRIRKVFAVTHPRWKPYAGKPHVRFCAWGVR
jgi:RNA-directed DNA polymerase